jgi:ERCC4-related helicase
MINNKNKKNPDLKFIEVHTVQGPVEAEVIKSLLESHGISVFLKGLVVQSVHAFSADGLGKITVLVKEEDFETAQQIINSNLTD